MSEQCTQARLLEAGMAEFLEKGFKGASLRHVAKMAGVTTGAFYGYYSSKGALFTAIVEPYAKEAMRMFMAAQTEFAELPKEEQHANMGTITSACVDAIIEYMYAHLDAFKLLICCAEGSPYESFINDMVDVEVEATFRYMDVLRSLGHDVPDIDKEVSHMLSTAWFNGLFEILRHDMPKDRAIRFVHQLEEFSKAGWAKLLGMNQD